MRILATFGFGLLALAALCFYAEQKRGAGLEDANSSTVERVLKAESRKLSSRIEEAALKADRDAQVTAARWRRKPRMRTFLSDTALAEPDAPKWVIATGRRIRAAGTLDDALLEDALEMHVSGRERFQLYSSRGKYYLFVRGVLADGQPYAAAYAPESFFSAFRTGEGLRVWIAGRDGSVIFHPLPRFIGSNVANLRPVAAGLQLLKEGKAEQFTRKYLGLEGKDALGSWAVLPEQGLLVASEWPRELAGASRFSLFFWFALGFGALGVFFFGLAFGFRPERKAAPSERLFQVDRLDPDTLEYLETAKASADEAIVIAKEQEAAAEEARRDRARFAGLHRRMEAKITMLEAFQDKVLPLLTGKQVWPELAKLFCESAPGVTVVVYRFSPSSFSLVPDACFDGAGLAENALAYLQDARIFIGNSSSLLSVLKTEAFSKWNRARERHMPLHRTDFRVLSFEAQGTKGAVMVFYDERINQKGELEDVLLWMEQLVRRTGTFCDSLTPLLQSSYAKANAGQALASAPNGAGNRSRPS